jgi:alpha-glucosidase
MSWWRDAVIYQVYPRSFNDSNADGVGDLRGIESRLGHLADLGADALWLSPIYPSPLADFGYDVADYQDVDPTYGTLQDFDRLVAGAHARGLKLLMDLVPCHTSIEHPWFTDRPDFYIWADGRGEGPPNNWVAAFGGPAWTRHEDMGRWYLHSFYPEQPDLDWRNPEVVTAMQGVLRFWLDRGVDGFRVDAIDRLVKDAELRDDPPASAPFALPLTEEYARLEHLYSANSPDIQTAVGALREAAGDALLVGEVYLPAADVAPYLEHLDVAFAFELFHSPWEHERLREAIEACAALEAPAGGPGSAWVLSNHDFPRLPDRFGAENVRSAAMLMLTLPGPCFIYQGDEIGQHNGPERPAGFDRAGRDPYRHPVQWEPEPLRAGFTSGEPWLAPVDAAERSVAAQRTDPGSVLSLYRDLIALRPRLHGGLEMLGCTAGLVAYARGSHVVVVNTTGRALALPGEAGAPLLTTHEDAIEDGRLVGHAGAVLARA